MNLLDTSGRYDRWRARRVADSGDESRDERGRWTSGEGGYVYHGTSRASLDGIRERGLVADPTVWTTSTEEGARGYAVGSDTVVLRIRSDRVEDIQYSGHSRHGGFNQRTATTIDPRHIEYNDEAGSWKKLVNVADAFDPGEERDDRGRWVYHGTHMGNMESIKKEGLRAQKGKYRPLYFHTVQSESEFYSNYITGTGTTGAVLRVQLSDVPRAKKEGPYFTTTAKVHPSKIEIKQPDGSWKKLLGDSAFVSDASLARHDPTGTGPLRGKFRNDLDRRWARLRHLSIEAIDKANILGLGTPTVLTIASSMRGAGNGHSHAPLPGVDKVQGFQRWFDEALRQVVLENDGAWTAKYINDATLLAQQRAEHLVGARFGGIVGEFDRSGVLRSVAVSELQGVCEAVSQQAVRAVAEGIMLRWRPAKVARAVAERVNAIGKTRSRLFANHMVVKTHAAATLDAYRAMGISKVGTIPEHRPKVQQTAHGKTLARDAGPDDEPRDERGRWIGGILYHYKQRETEPRLSTRPRLIPNSISLTTDPAAHELFGPHRYTFELEHGTKIMHVDRRELDPEHHSGQELYDRAKAGGYKAIRLFGNGPDEYAVIDKSAIRSVVDPHGRQSRLADASVGWRATASTKASSIFERRPTKSVGRVSYGKSYRSKAPSARELRAILRGEARVQALGEVDVLTAGDDDVCFACQEISDGGPYDIDEAESLIPAHLGCRCAFVPAADARFAEVGDAVDDEPRDEHGRWMSGGTAFHGSHDPDIKSFDRMKGYAAERKMDSASTIGTWFTTSKEDARGFGPHVYEASLGVSNPLVVQGWSGFQDVAAQNKLLQKSGPQKGQVSGTKMRAWLEKKGYDGVHMKGGEDDVEGLNYLIVLHPEHISIKGKN